MSPRFACYSLILFGFLFLGAASTGESFAQAQSPLPPPEYSPRNPIASDFLIDEVFIPTSETNANAGRSVDIDGDVAVVGVPLEDVGGNTDSGAVYIYRRTFNPEPVWTLEQKLTLTSPTPTGFSGTLVRQRFGYDVALDGGKLIVGAPAYDLFVPARGTVFFYEDLGGAWIYRTHFTVDDGTFGDAVAIDGNRAAASDPEMGNQGVVNIYEFSGSNWSFVQSIIQPDGEINYVSAFGSAIALDGDILVVGHPYWEPVAFTDPSSVGIVWVFRWGISDSFEYDEPIYAPQVDSGNAFGWAVDVHDGTFEDLFFIGMPTLYWRGTAYMFAETTTSGGIHLISTFQALTNDANDTFGMSVAIDKSDTLRAVVGAKNGIVTILERTGTGKGQPFEIQTEYPYSNAAGNQFGQAVAIDNYSIHAGAFSEYGYPNYPSGYSAIIDEYGLGINTGTVNQPLKEGGSLFYTVRLTRRPTANVTVTPSQPFGGSQAGQCENLSPTMTFTPANYASEQGVLATVVQDTWDEGLHYCTISNNYTSTDPNYYENFLNGREVSFEIIDDDRPVPALSINDPAGYECTDGYSRDLPFVVSLSGTSTNTITVDYETFADSAEEDVDYDFRSGTLTIPAGNASGIFMVEMRCDNLFENSEQFSVSLSNPVNATIADGSGFGEIINDDPMPSITVSTPSLPEGNSGNSTFPVTVTFTLPTELDGGFYVSTIADTATSGTDFQALTTFSPLTIPASTSSMTFNLTVFGDTTVEDDEIFYIRISPAMDEANFRMPNDEQYRDYPVTIINDDSAPVPSASIGDAGLTECDGSTGSTLLNFTVSLSSPAVGGETVSYATQDVTATGGSDYFAASDTLTFGTGESSQQISIYVYCDDVPESTETFQVVLSSPSGLTITDGTGVGTITDTDTGPAVSVLDKTVSECSGGSNTTMTISITFSSSFAISAPVEIDYATSDITAQAGSDYNEDSGTVIIPANLTTANVWTEIYCDDVVEPDETFAVDITSSTNSTIGDASAVITIEDDDESPIIPAITISDSLTSECTGFGIGSITFPVNLDQAATQPVTADWETSDITATAGLDYIAASGTLTFSIGETFQPITIMVYCDAIDEPDETFAINITSSSNATIADGSAVGTIVDDDDPLPDPTVSVNDAGGYECSPMPFYTTRPIISAFNLASGTVTVDWHLTSSNATAGEDYVDASGMVTLTSASPMVEVPVILLCDEFAEPDETVQIVLSNVSGANATIADSTGIINLYNDDPNSNSDDVTFLLQNPGFETAVNGTDWKITSDPATPKNDLRKCNKPSKDKYFSAERNCAFVFVGGQGENSQLKQIIKPAISMSDTDFVTFWMLYKAGTAVSAKAGFNIIYSDGTPKQKVPTTLAGTAGSFTELVAGEQLSSGAVKKIVVYVTHSSLSGKLTIDATSFYITQPTLPPREAAPLSAPLNLPGFQGLTN